jgi:hypothetical protein
MATGEELTDRFRELRTSLEALPEVTEPPKPMLRILGSARAEQKWNILLAYFLDPSQPHGFNATLLKVFLDNVSQVTDDRIDYYHREFSQVTVETEVASPQNNRPDLLIRAPGEWFVCVESKVDSSEGDRQTQRYIEDTHIGTEEKDAYPEDGQHYLFLSKKYAPDSSAAGFEDLSWRDVVGAFQNELNLSHGQYPERSVSQLEDFLSTIITVTNMEDDDFEQIQKEKVQLLSEYRDEIDELLNAADALHERAVEDWAEMFRSQVNDEVWTDEWHLRDDEYGRIFKHGWYLDSNLEPTINPDEAWGDSGLRIHFMHYIRKKPSFRRGELKFELITNSLNRVDVRDEFHRLYDTDRWQAELQPILSSHKITNVGQKKALTRKKYDVDQSRLPESYFETLTVAFEEHLRVVEVVDEILDEAVGNVKSKS